MRTIYKYPFKILGSNSMFTIELPEKAEILSIQIQNDTPCLWALVNTDNPSEKKIFVVQGTGQKIYRHILLHKYLATIQDGNIVWHIFEYAEEVEYKKET